MLVPAPFHNSLVCKPQSKNPVVVFFISFIRLEIKEIIIYIVLQVAWEFYIGGYQPAQKWLKDRKERTLEFEDILHYQKIIVALFETDRLMKEIDKVEIE